jgi:hypothetical protein
MSTLSVPEIPLEAASPAQRLRRMAAAVRVHFTWWGTHRTLTSQQKEEVGATYSADARLLTAGKKLVDTKHEAFRKLTSLRSRVASYWRGLTLPYTEPGVRLIRHADIEAFVHTMEGHRDELVQAEADLNAVYDQVKRDAHRLVAASRRALPAIDGLERRGDGRAGQLRGWAAGRCRRGPGRLGFGPAVLRPRRPHRRRGTGRLRWPLTN